MMASAMARKLLDGARGTVQAAGGLARHVIWYVSYQVDGTAHDVEAAGRRRTPPREGEGAREETDGRRS